MTISTYDSTTVGLYLGYKAAYYSVPGLRLLPGAEKLDNYLYTKTNAVARNWIVGKLVQSITGMSVSDHANEFLAASAGQAASAVSSTTSQAVADLIEWWNAPVEATLMDSASWATGQALNFMASYINGSGERGWELFDQILHLDEKLKEKGLSSEKFYGGDTARTIIKSILRFAMDIMIVQPFVETSTSTHRAYAWAMDVSTRLPGVSNIQNPLIRLGVGAAVPAAVGTYASSGLLMSLLTPFITPVAVVGGAGAALAAVLAYRNNNPEGWDALCESIPSFKMAERSFVSYGAPGVFKQKDLFAEGYDPMKDIARLYGLSGLEDKQIIEQSENILERILDNILLIRRAEKEAVRLEAKLENVGPKRALKMVKTQAALAHQKEKIETAQEQIEAYNETYERLISNSLELKYRYCKKQTDAKLAQLALVEARQKGINSLSADFDSMKSSIKQLEHSVADEAHVQQSSVSDLSAQLEVLCSQFLANAYSHTSSARLAQIEKKHEIRLNDAKNDSEKVAILVQFCEDLYQLQNTQLNEDLHDASVARPDKSPTSLNEQLLKLNELEGDLNKVTQFLAELKQARIASTQEKESQLLEMQNTAIEAYKAMAASIISVQGQEETQDMIKRHFDELASIGSSQSVLIQKIENPLLREAQLVRARIQILQNACDEMSQIMGMPVSTELHEAKKALEIAQAEEEGIRLSIDAQLSEKAAKLLEELPVIDDKTTALEVYQRLLKAAVALKEGYGEDEKYKTQLDLLTKNIQSLRTDHPLAAHANLVQEGILGLTFENLYPLGSDALLARADIHDIENGLEVRPQAFDMHIVDASKLDTQLGADGQEVSEYHAFSSNDIRKVESDILNRYFYEKPTHLDGAIDRRFLDNAEAFSVGIAFNKSFNELYNEALADTEDDDRYEALTYTGFIKDQLIGALHGNKSLAGRVSQLMTPDAAKVIEDVVSKQFVKNAAVAGDDNDYVFFNGNQHRIAKGARPTYAFKVLPGSERNHPNTAVVTVSVAWRVDGHTSEDFGHPIHVYSADIENTFRAEFSFRVDDAANPKPTSWSSWLTGGLLGSDEGRYSKDSSNAQAKLSTQKFEMAIHDVIQVKTA